MNIDSEINNNNQNTININTNTTNTNTTNYNQIILNDQNTNMSNQNNNTIENNNNNQDDKQIQSKKKKIMKIKKIKHYKEYMEHENRILLNSYGSQHYMYNLHLDMQNDFPDILSNHDITNDVRARMINWMFEIALFMKCSDLTIYKMVHLLDCFLFKFRDCKLKNTDMHLLGVACIFLASKFDDINPIYMRTLRYDIAHNTFNDDEIKSMEKKILDVVNFSTLVNTSTYEFINTYIYDLKINNKSYLDKTPNSYEILDKINCMALDLSKVMMHFAYFSTYRYSIKAVVCIISSFDHVRTLENELDDKLLVFLSDYIKQLIKTCNFDPKDLGNLSNQTREYYNYFLADNKWHAYNLMSLPYNKSS